MEYITSRQAAEKWGVTLRTVQTYLKSGRIPGAVTRPRLAHTQRRRKAPRYTRRLA